MVGAFERWIEMTQEAKESRHLMKKVGAKLMMRQVAAAFASWWGGACQHPLCTISIPPSYPLNTISIPPSYPLNTPSVPSQYPLNSPSTTPSIPSQYPHNIPSAPYHNRVEGN